MPKQGLSRLATGKEGTLRIAVLNGGSVCVVFMVLAMSLDPIRGFAEYSLGKVRGGYTVAERVTQYGQTVEARLRRQIEAAGLAYPPHDVTYVAFKDSRRLEVYGRMFDDQSWRLIAEYPILAESGTLGPKLKEGDEQVPEGIYRAESLNPNSRFHLSIRVNYPNEFDRRMAQADGRTQLGGDIMIHGNSVSIGCLAMGDQAAEDLFILAALATKERVRIVISPTDFRMAGPMQLPNQPAWVGSLYDALRAELQQYRKIM